MEEGEDSLTAAASSNSANQDTEVKMEVKDEDVDVKNENEEDEDAMVLKEYYDQDVRVDGKGATYRVTLMLVGKPISYPDESTPDDWCNLPFESLRALDSATLAFVRYAPSAPHCVSHLSNIQPVISFFFEIGNAYCTTVTVSCVLRQCLCSTSRGSSPLRSLI